MNSNELDDLTVGECLQLWISEHNDSLDLSEKKLTQDDIAKVLNVSSNAVNMYLHGSRGIQASQIRDICKHYGVSADYLLGLSDQCYPNEDIKATRETIGLSTKAIKKLMDLNNLNNQSMYKKNAYALINDFITSNYFDLVLRESENAIALKNSKNKIYEDVKKKYRYPTSMALEIYIRNMVLLVENYLDNFLKGGN